MSEKHVGSVSTCDRGIIYRPIQFGVRVHNGKSVTSTSEADVLEYLYATFHTLCTESPLTTLRKVTPRIYTYGRVTFYIRRRNPWSYMSPYSWYRLLF